MEGSNFMLFEVEQQIRDHFSEPRQIDLGTYRWWGRNGDQPFHVEIDALPLLTLVEEATFGARIYEFLTITRPGDLQHYLRVRPVSLEPMLSTRFEKDPNNLFPIPEPAGDGYLPFVKFDSFFRWDGDDTRPEAHCWLANREKKWWKEFFTDLLDKVSVLQGRLRNSDDMLAQREVLSMDTHRHQRAFLPGIRRECRVEREVPETSTIPESLLTAIESLIARDTVRSVSCPLGDYWLWRKLVEEQLHRSSTSGRKPQAAFWLSGPDSGLSAPWEDWCGYVHIPYEGACMADLFIQPNWRMSYPESDVQGGKLCDVLYPAGRGFNHPQCHYLLTQKDLGELHCARRTALGDAWVLYESKAPYLPVISSA